MAPWDTWEKRIDWIRQNRGLSMSGLSEAAGLSRATVGNTIRRERDGETVGFSGDSLTKIAKAARVSIEWLTTGQGQPEPGYVAEPPLATDTQSIAKAAAQMLVELDGLALSDALLLVYDVRLPEPTVDGYYRAARRALAGRAANEPQSMVPRSVRDAEEAAEREIRADMAGGVRRKNKHRN